MHSNKTVGIMCFHEGGGAGEEKNNNHTHSHIFEAGKTATNTFCIVVSVARCQSRSVQFIDRGWMNQLNYIDSEGSYSKDFIDMINVNMLITIHILSNEQMHKKWLTLIITEEEENKSLEAAMVDA